MQTSRMSSWVLRSGASQRVDLAQPRALRVVQRGEDLVERLLERESSSRGCAESRSSARRPELHDRDVLARRVEHASSAMPISSASNSQSTTFVIIRGPSSRSTTAATYGIQVGERRQVVAVHDRPRVERRPTARLEPLDVVAPAVRAERARVEVVLPARVAVLDEQPLFSGRVPERLRLEIGRGQVEPHLGHESATLRGRRLSRERERRDCHPGELGLAGLVRDRALEIDPLLAALGVDLRDLHVRGEDLAGPGLLGEADLVVPQVADADVVGERLGRGSRR